MALAFQSTSISAANAAAAGTAAQSAIRDALLAHVSGAWTLVEEFDSSGGTIHWVVLKNATAQSAVGSDFYVCIGRIVATGQLGVMLSEVYTPTTTHSLGIYVPQSGGFSTSQLILADHSYSEGTSGAASSYNLGTTLAPGTGKPFCSVNTPAATMRFVTAIEKDYAIVYLNTTAWYIGALTDLMIPGPSVVAATPIGLCDLFQTNQALFGGLTRHPIAAADAPLGAGNSHQLQPLSANMTWLQRQAVDISVYGGADRYQANRVAASELAALMYGGIVANQTPNTPTKMGALRGKFKGLRASTFPGAAVIFDTIVVDAKKHIILLDKNTIGNAGGEFVSPQGLGATVKYGIVADTGVAAP